MFDNLETKKYQNWSDTEKKIAEKACHPFDSVGIMYSKGLIDEDLIIKWRRSIIKVWEIAKPMIKEYQEQREKDFWGDFENLYNKIK